MSITEKVLEELNECRTNPRKYSLKLSKTLKFYQGKILSRPGSQPIETEEGLANVQACINYLKSIMPIGELEPSVGLKMAAQSHADDIGPSGRMSHLGEDGSEPSDRIEKFCQWSGHLGENIDYGNSNPEDIVVSLLIDDGVLARGQRLNIMKKEHKYVGIGFGYHSEFEYVCVIVFTELAIDPSFSTFSSKISPKKIKRSEYVQKKEITEEHSKLLASKIMKQKLRDQPSETLNLKKFDSNKYENTQFSHDEIIEIKEFFDMLDHDYSGTISVTEIKNLVEAPDITNSSIYQMLMGLNLNNAGTLDFGGFLDLISVKGNKEDPTFSVLAPIKETSTELSNFSHQFSHGLVSEFKEVFDFFDSEKSGFIEIGAIRAAAENHELDSYNSTILDLMTGLDPSKNNKVDFEEFVEIISEISNSSISSSMDLSGKNKTGINKSRSRKVQMSSYEFHDSWKRMRKNEFEVSEFENSRVNEEQIQEIKKAFDLFDVEKKGLIATRDLKSAMEEQGYQKKNPIVYQLVCDLVKKNSEEVDFEKFVQMLTENHLENGSDDEIKKFFDLFDSEKLGYIDLHNLKKATRELGDVLDDSDIIDLIWKSDLDGDGKVTYQDFYNIMNKFS